MSESYAKKNYKMKNEWNLNLEECDLGPRTYNSSI